MKARVLRVLAWLFARLAAPVLRVLNKHPQQWVALACVLVSAVAMWHGLDGWQWFLIVAVFLAL